MSKCAMLCGGTMRWARRHDAKMSQAERLDEAIVSRAERDAHVCAALELLLTWMGEP